MLDYIIANGLIVDGSGGTPFNADVGIQDGAIVAIGDLAGREAIETIDASGRIVTPGFIDIHTHYDGQVSWDDRIDPSFSHGVTTIVMGNCGVGFAPVRRGSEQQLIELMEGVEDIPGSVLSEGIRWTWESFPEYLDMLAGRKWSMDVAAMVPHAPLRTFVMGDRGFRNEDASPEDIREMGRLVGEALDAGAVGFSTSRINAHTSLHGESVPGTYADDAELLGIAHAMQGRQCVFEIVPGGLEGKEPFSHDDFRKIDPQTGRIAHAEASYEHELDLIARISAEYDIPVTFLFSQSKRQPGRHRIVLDFVARKNAGGTRIRPQVNPRPVGMLTSFQSYNLFQRRPSFMKIAALPPERRIVELRKPEVREAILSEQDAPPAIVGNFTENLHSYLAQHMTEAFPMGMPLDFEPMADQAVVALAERNGISAEAQIYDLMLEHDGRAIIFYALTNYGDRNFDELRKMILDDATVVGGSDGGAHVRYICDASLPTYALIHWVRDRTRGARIPLETMVRLLTADNAALFGFDDRGVIATGRRADINIIDLDALDLLQPYPVNDLPGDGVRLLQKSRGYAATFVRGVITRRDDADTGARPGRLVRGGAVTAGARALATA